MTVDEAQATLEAAGLQLQSKERTGNNDGWCLKFTTKEIVNVYDTGNISYQGRNQDRTRAILGAAPAAGSPGSPAAAPSRRVFVVYGHDPTARTQLEAMLRRWDLEPLILDQLASEGQTVIEKLERYTTDGVRFAVVLATPDDEGYPRAQPGEKKFRARQNVVLELGMLFSTLGRHRVAILLKDDPAMERPSDIAGILELRFRNDVEEIKVQLAKEMEKQGLKIEVGKL